MPANGVVSPALAESPFEGISPAQFWIRACYSPLPTDLLGHGEAVVGEVVGVARDELGEQDLVPEELGSGRGEGDDAVSRLGPRVPLDAVQPEPAAGAGQSGAGIRDKTQWISVQFRFSSPARRESAVPGRQPARSREMRAGPHYTTARVHLRACGCYLWVSCTAIWRRSSRVCGQLSTLSALKVPRARGIATSG